MLSILSCISENEIRVIFDRTYYLRSFKFFVSSDQGNAEGIKKWRIFNLNNDEKRDINQKNKKCKKK